MPPVSSRRRGRFRILRWIGFALIVVVALGWWGALSLGRVLYREDPLERADAIFVLGGNWLDRVAEGGDLYLEGRAPFILLAREYPDDAEQALRDRGIPVKGVSDVQVATLIAMGVPAPAIALTEPQSATATEAEALRRIAAERRWKRVIIVTSKSHTARAHLAFTRHLEGSGVQIAMRASRYDRWNPDEWWTDRVGFRVSLIEAQKMLLYWLGAAD